MAKTLYLEDIEAGTCIESDYVEIERAEIIRFAERWDPQPFHIDEEAAKASLFGGLTACAAHGFAIMSLLTHHQPLRLALAAGLGNEGMDLVNPIRPGDRIRLVTEILDKRESKTRSTLGIVRIEHRLENQKAEVVLRAFGKLMILRRPIGKMQS